MLFFLFTDHIRQLLQKAVQHKPPRFKPAITSQQGESTKWIPRNGANQNNINHSGAMLRLWHE